MGTTEELPNVPHSDEAESTVLASCMMYPEIFAEIRPLLRPRSFYSADYGVIYESMCAVADASKPVSAELVREHLKNRGVYEEIGGIETLRRLLTGEMFTPSFAEHYANVVAEKAKLREFFALSAELQKRCLARSRFVEQASGIAKWLEESIEEIIERGYRDSIRTLSDVVMETIEAKERKDVERVKTGIAALDETCGGLPIAGQTLVAGKAGMGKSQLCKQFVHNIASAGTPCGIIAIEESARKIAENYLAAASGIQNSKIVYNTLTAEEMGEVVNAAGNLSALPIFIDDAQDKLSEIERTVRRMVRKHKCGVIVVDHLHLINGEYDGPREQEISRISGGLKKLWKELNVVGVVAAQLNRGGENEAPPELRDLRGSGSLEQDGDLIIQLHRQDYYEWRKRGEAFQPDHRLRMYVNKNKGGPVGYEDAYFDGDSQTVTNWNDGYGPFPVRQYAPIRPPAYANNLDDV